MWLGLGTTPPELPFPGVVGPWGNGFRKLVCSEVVMENCDGYPLPPERTPLRAASMVANSMTKNTIK